MCSHPYVALRATVCRGFDLVASLRKENEKKNKKKISYKFND